MLLRSMAPRTVAVDELGGEADVRALSQVLKCGCSVIATVHGQSFSSLKTRTAFVPIFREKMFDRICFLERESNRFYVRKIYDSNGCLLAQDLPC